MDFKNEKYYLRDEEMYLGSSVFSTLQNEEVYKNKELQKLYFFRSKTIFNYSCY
jgi:hypothetical protein